MPCWSWRNCCPFKQKSVSVNKNINNDNCVVKEKIIKIYYYSALGNNFTDLTKVIALQTWRFQGMFCTIINFSTRIKFDVKLDQLHVCFLFDIINRVHVYMYTLALRSVPFKYTWGSAWTWIFVNTYQTSIRTNTYRDILCILLVERE